MRGGFFTKFVALAHGAAVAQYGAGGQLLHHLGVCIRLLKHPRCQSIMASGSGAENQYYGNFLS